MKRRSWKNDGLIARQGLHDDVVDDAMEHVDYKTLPMGYVVNRRTLLDGSKEVKFWLINLYSHLLKPSTDYLQ